MEKKRSVGIIVAAVLKIVFGFIFSILIVFFTLSIIDASPQRVSISTKLSGIFMSVFVIVYTINSFFLLALKNLARKISIVLDVIAIIIDSTVLFPGILNSFRYGGMGIDFYGFHLPIIALFSAFIYYFMNPKIKDKFR